MNKRQKEVMGVQLSDEQRTIKELKQVYRKAQRDVEANISALLARTDTENLASIVYQVNYQKAILKQIEGTLDVLNTEQFNSISDFLGKSYANGYLGVMYDLQGQGIPIIAPIDNEMVVKALQTDSKISNGLYARLGIDTKELKDSIRANLSRGVSSGASWDEIARNINARMNIGLNRSIRIARTEGHRVQCESGYQAQQVAKSKGADIVKQWCATLDGRTRPNHRLLDGVIKPIDEPFEIDGNEAMYPADFGVAREDVNCRCTLLQRAKWALDADELKTLEDRAAYFGLDKTADFSEYKRVYMGIDPSALAISATTSGSNRDYSCDLATKTGKDFYDALHDKLDECENQDLVKAWNVFEKDIRVRSITESSAYCEGSSGNIHIHTKKDATGSSWEAPYAVTFHESGHGIDNLAQSKAGNGFRGFSINYKNGLFPQTIESEVKDLIDAYDKAIKTDWKAHSGDWKYLHDKGYISDWSFDFFKDYGKWVGGEPKYSKSLAYSFLEREIKEISSFGRSDISDMLEGVTRGKISCGFGHRKTYWTKRMIGGRNGGLAMEAFAEMTSATVTNPESLSTIKKYLPKSYGVWEDMIKEISKMG